MLAARLKELRKERDARAVVRKEEPAAIGAPATSPVQATGANPNLSRKPKRPKNKKKKKGRK